jgi:hypothetical protein
MKTYTVTEDQAERVRALIKFSPMDAFNAGYARGMMRTLEMLDIPRQTPVVPAVKRVWCDQRAVCNPGAICSAKAPHDRGQGDCNEHRCPDSPTGYARCVDVSV